jgi:hypothetical protein
LHLKNIFNDSELSEILVTKVFSATASDGIFGLHLKNIYAEGELDAISTTEDYSVVGFSSLEITLLKSISQFPQKVQELVCFFV